MTGTAQILIGSSAAMRDLRGTVERLAATDGPVLIQGERGTGKVAVARALHAASRRCDGPVVVVDCASLSDPDLFADLFGSEQQATATYYRGRLTTADGGTLVLREVGAVGPVVSRGLLQALRTGAHNVRLLATTSHEPDTIACDGPAIGELIGRLSTDVVAVPPLRDRPDDVFDLSRHFLSIAARRERIRPCEPEAATVELFRQYPWPRNVRELQNFVDRACTVAGSENPLRVSLIEPWLRAAAAAVDPVQATVEALAGKPLADIEKQVILSTLQQFRGHRIKTAGALGIGVRTLGIKLKRWRDEGEPVIARNGTNG